MVFTNELNERTKYRRNTFRQITELKNKMNLTLHRNLFGNKYLYLTFYCALILQVLGSYINPGGVIPKDFCDQEGLAEKITVSASNSDYAAPSREWPLPEVLFELLSHSCLIPAISSYLRNDSVLDMARHVPLYRALLHLLRGEEECTCTFDVCIHLFVIVDVRICISRNACLLLMV